jgi:predicted DNA binding CopG/RHH family protein
MVMLDPEEKELLDPFERDEWQLVKGKEAESQHYREYALATFKKDRRVTDS